MDEGAAFASNVQFLPLDDPELWARTIAESSLKRNPKSQQNAIDAGFDIHTSARILQDFYLSRWQEVQG